MSACPYANPIKPDAGRRKHQYRGETVCAECADLFAAAQRDRYHRHRGPDPTQWDAAPVKAIIERRLLGWDPTDDLRPTIKSYGPDVVKAISRGHFGLDGADRIAMRLGFHPSEIWDTWGADVADGEMAAA